MSWTDRWWFGPVVFVATIVGGPVGGCALIWWLNKVACWWFPWMSECQP